MRLGIACSQHRIVPFRPEWMKMIRSIWAARDKWSSEAAQEEVFRVDAVEESLRLLRTESLPHMAVASLDVVVTERR